MDHNYDAIVVGGRCAGAATAMLLSRGGMRVLVVEATRPGSDTLSTHALMRGGVLQLHRWGLLDAVIDAGTPAIVSTEFAYGEDIETVDIRPSGGISALRAPRRTVLDALLLEAARTAGAEVRAPARVTRLLTDGSRVRGIEGIERGTGTRFRATAPLTIGADGRNSTIAQTVDAPFRRRGTVSGAIVYGYFPGLARDRYHWAYRHGGDRGRGAHRRRFGVRLVGHRKRQVRPTAVRRAGRYVPVAACRGHPGAGRLYRRHTTRRHVASLPRPARLDPRVRRPGLGVGR